MKQIIKNFLKGFKGIGEETLKEGVKHTGTVAETIITGKALLGDITTMTDSQYKSESQMYKNKDEEEMAKLRAQIKGESSSQGPGRNVEAEMKEVDEEKKQKEADEARFLQNLERQREQERQEMAAMGIETPTSRQSRGKQNGGGKKKKQQPDAAMMSQTQEIKGKVD